MAPGRVSHASISFNCFPCYFNLHSSYKSSPTSTIKSRASSRDRHKTALRVMSLLFAESSFCGPVNDLSSHTGASDSHGSTPPTTVSDAASLHSDTSKHDAAVIDPEPLESITVSLPEPFTKSSTEDGATANTRSLLTATTSLTDTATPSAESTPGRGRRARASAPIYNLARLSGTASHGKRRANGDVVDSKSSLRRQSLANQSANGSPMSTRQTRPSNKVVREGIDALDLQWSLSKLESPRTRRKTHTAPQPTRLVTRRSASEAVTALSNKVSALGKRIRKPSEKALENVPRELRKLQDTKEFSHIDDKPVRYTVWSNGKYVDPNAPAEPPAKKAKTVEPLAEASENAEAASEPITHMRKRRPKKYLDKGLYAGQEKPLDPVKCLSPAEKKKWALLPELHSTGRINTVMPAPVFNGLRLLVHGRDFKLPYNVCHPSPPGQPKPDEWKKMTRSKSQARTPLRSFHILTTTQIVSLVIRKTIGANFQCSTIRSVCALPTMAVARIARTESCSTNATTTTAMLARSSATTAPLPISWLVEAKAASTVLASRSSRPLTAATAFAAIVTSARTRSSWNTRVKSSRRKNAKDA